MEAKVCGTCAFGQDVGKPEDMSVGIMCHLSPPRLAPRGADPLYLDSWIHPMVSSNDFCGRWAPKPQGGKSQ